MDVSSWELLCVVIGCDNSFLVKNISCKCHFKAARGDSDDLIFRSRYWSANHEDVTLSLENIFLWFNSWETWAIKGDDQLNKYYEATFEFCATECSKKLISMTKCGIHLIYDARSNNNPLNIVDEKFSVGIRSSGEPSRADYNHKRGHDDHYTGGRPSVSGKSDDEEKTNKRIKRCSF